MPNVSRVIIAVTADTHLRGDVAGALAAGASALLAEADVILHAGDITTEAVLEELRAFAPVHAVLGNNDTELAGLLPGSRELVLEGLRIAMVHDSGPSAGRAGRMKRHFPDADLVVYGHSHVPTDLVGIGNQVLFNPGSPTQRRQQPFATIGRLHVESGRLVGREIRPLPRD